MRRSVLDEWSESWCQWWDQAVRGSSALQAAFGRLLVEEVHAALGWTIAAGLTDLKGFYDHIWWGKLAKEGKTWHYPHARDGDVSPGLCSASAVVLEWLCCAEADPARQEC